jgi:hypothetical protein
MKQKHFVIFLLMTSCIRLFANDGQWLPPVPPNWSKNSRANEIAEEMVREVIHSQVQHAMQILGAKHAIEVDSSLMELLSGRSWPLNKGKHFVLVRACFGNGATGGYMALLSNDGKDLLVGHLSLGSATRPTNSVLLLQLEIVPTNVFSSVSFAK